MTDTRVTQEVAELGMGGPGASAVSQLVAETGVGGSGSSAASQLVAEIGYTDRPTSLVTELVAEIGMPFAEALDAGGSAQLWPRGGDAVPNAINAPSGAAGGDLGLTYPNPAVVGLRGRALSPAAPDDGQGYVWDAAANLWVPRSLTGVPRWMLDAHLGLEVPGAPNAADDEFDVGVALDTTGARRAGATPWATRNPSTTTYDYVNGRLVITAPASGGNNIRGAEQVIAGATWAYRAEVYMLSRANNFCQGGLYVALNSNGRIIVNCHAYEGGPQGGVVRWTNASTFASWAVGPNREWPCYLFGGFFHIQYDGANLQFFQSRTGDPDSFWYMHLETPANFLTAVPDRVGVFVNPSNNFKAITVVRSFRKVALLAGAQLGL